MARDATARLYDVDEDSVVYTKPDVQGKYDRGTIAFQAKKSRLIDLNQLHESIWATRLSGGTSSGCLSLEVTAVGDVAADGNQLVMNIKGSDGHYVLAAVSAEGKSGDAGAGFSQLRKAIHDGETVVSVTGRVDGWKGKWPVVLREKPTNPWRIFVTSFQTTGK